MIFFCYCYFANYFLAKRLGEQEIWYLLHVTCNTLVVYFCYKDLKVCLLTPFESFNKIDFTPTALGLTLGLHLFHIVKYFKKLTFLDWVHHLLSNVFMTIIGVYYFRLPIWNCGNFFMCGLPGGIDYFLLFLYKVNKIKKTTEKKYNVYLNNWIRVPGILYTSSLIHIGYINNYIDVEPILIIIIQLAILWNALYFAQRVTLNYGQYISI